MTDFGACPKEVLVEKGMKQLQGEKIGLIDTPSDWWLLVVNFACDSD